jgi:hypothetical protein
MRPKLQKQSELKLAGRIIPGAQRRGKTSFAKFEAQVELMKLKYYKRSAVIFVS